MTSLPRLFLSNSHVYNSDLKPLLNISIINILDAKQDRYHFEHSF